MGFRIRGSIRKSAADDDLGRSIWVETFAGRTECLEARRERLERLLDGGGTKLEHSFVQPSWLSDAWAINQQPDLCLKCWMLNSLPWPF